MTRSSFIPNVVLPTALAVAPLPSPEIVTVGPMVYPEEVFGETVKGVPTVTLLNAES